ncbi:MAG: MerR family transcriptional regulator [Planctomycetota bacterium]
MTLMNTVETQIPRKLYRMGEIVQHTGLSRQTVHNYTTMGLIRESEWTPGGHRLYDETVFGRLSQISNLKKTMKMEQILDVLKGEVQPE